MIVSGSRGASESAKKAGEDCVVHDDVPLSEGEDDEGEIDGDGTGDSGKDE